MVAQLAESHGETSQVVPRALGVRLRDYPPQTSAASRPRCLVEDHRGRRDTDLIRLWYERLLVQASHRNCPGEARDLPRLKGGRPEALQAHAKRDVRSTHPGPGSVETCGTRGAEVGGFERGSLGTTSEPFGGRVDLPSVVTSLLLARDLRWCSEVCETVRPLPEVQGRTGPTGWLDGAAHCRAYRLSRKIDTEIY